MKRRWMLACWMGALVLATTASVPAQGGDEGKSIEKEFGVVDRSSREGRRLNEQMDRVVGRIVDAVNRTSSGRFSLKSALILGGRSDKHDKAINAFALPDGRIYVTLGLIRELENSRYADDELAFVVGHEVTHVAEKHSRNQQKKALPVGIAAVLLGVLTKNRTVGTVANAGASAYVSSFGRKDEYRADRGGLLAMHSARYELDASVTMLERLKSQGEESNRVVNGLFGSHPFTGNRIERIKQMISDIESGRSVPDRTDKELERDDKRKR